MKMDITAEEAFSRLAALCARGERCRGDMLDKMRLWGLTDGERAAVMAKLEEGRYVDDERYARAFARDKVRYAKWGRRKIEQALRMKHVDGEIVDSVLDGIGDSDYLSVLRPLLKQKLRTTKAADTRELHHKMVRYALGRGYTMDLLRQVLDTCDSDDTSYDE